MTPNLKGSAASGIMNTSATPASNPRADEPHHRHRTPEVASVENGDGTGAGVILGVEPNKDGTGQKMTANDPVSVPRHSPKEVPPIRRKANTVVETSASTVDIGRSASVGGERGSTSSEDNPRSGTQDTSPGNREDVDKSVHNKRNGEERKTEHRDTKKNKSKNASEKKEGKHRASKSMEFSTGEKHTAGYDDSESDSDYSSDTSSGSSSSDFSSSSASSEATRKDVKVRRKKKTKHSRRPRYSVAEKDRTDTAQQIQELGFQIAQLAQAVQSLQATSQPQQQYPAYVFGAQPQTSFLASQSTTLPGATSTNSSLPISEFALDNSRTSNRGSRRVGGGGKRPVRGHGSQPTITIVDSNGEAPGSTTHSKTNKKVNETKGTRSDYKRVDWVWDSSLYTWKLQDSAESTSDSRYEDYIFHVRRSFDIEGKYRSTTVDIKSKLLRECLQEVIGDIKGVSLVDESPKTDPNMLFLYLEDLRRHRKKLKQSKAVGETKKERKRNQRQLDDKRKQLKVLIGYLDKDYAQVKESLYPMLENGLITFELMWALWKPGTLAYTNTYGSTDDPRVFTVELAERHKSFMKGELYHLDGKYFEFDGKKFGHGGVSDEILAFRGARKITSLSCYPLKYHPDEERLRERLIERGKKFVSLSGVHYKSYTGMAYQKSKKSVIKFNIQQSRVMVDPAIFRRINPNYYISPVKAQEEPIMLGSRYPGEDDDEPCSSESSDDGQAHIIKGRRARRIAQALLGATSNGNEGQMSFDAEPRSAELGINDSSGAKDTQNDVDGTSPTFSDDEYLTASPVVLGFAFSEKQWLEFTVDNIKEIIWNDTAWDSLVSEPETKDLVQALVKSRKFNAANTIDDVIKGKGKGLVTVLHGPPGTGKTLTAEGISELLRCPLYIASAGELGTDSRFLEAELQKMLDICHAWGAILLLDEADVFLEKRNMLDIHRNALVSIFLRQLEYFQGILFLTTNRVETFDEAFQSRIHIALRYGALEPKAKKAIFQMFIEKVRSFGKMKVAEFSEEDLDALARKELNGREIKNVVSSAQDLAVSKAEALGMEHIRQVLDVHAKFGRDLKGGAGFEDAMRSYF